ncbi:MAG: sulfotransferase family protein [Flavobacteriales bacterium]
MPETIVRINAWCGPRNISTALMYSFAQRSDTRVYDEPLYGYYLNATPADQYHPGAKQVLLEMELDGNKVVAMMKGNHGKEVAFFKQMTHHLHELDRGFMADMKHLILTRDPVDMLPSFAKEIERPSMLDVGYQAHIELITYLENLGVTPIVLDSKNVLEHPEEQLQKLCAALNIPFEKAMLSWPKGARPEDGSWAKYWYKSVHNSSGFMPYNRKDEPFPEHLKPLLEASAPLYEQLKGMAL